MNVRGCWKWWNCKHVQVAHHTLRNRSKLPEDAGTREMVQSVQPDRDNVFGFYVEFLRHHGGDESRLMMVLLGMDDGSN